VARDWPLVVVDGFDHFTEVQLALLKVLAGRAGETIITLTGSMEGGEPRQVHRRFAKTCERCEAALGIAAQPLPHQTHPQTAALAHLEAGLYHASSGQVDGAGAVALIAAPDRAAEVRAALRWLKACLVQDGLRPGEVALLARKVTPYRPFILEVAEEFGLPIRQLDGLPLGKNPAVAALLDLLRLMLPVAGDGSQPGLPRRLVVDAWRSPYFDWSTLPQAGAAEAIGIEAGDAELLDTVARWGLVIGGWDQWQEVLDSLAARDEDAAQRSRATADQDEERGLPAGIPSAGAAQALRAKFERFVRRLRPPPGQRPYQDYVQWLEALIGPDPDLQPDRFAAREEPTALQIVRRARDGPEETRARDVAALQSLKDVLRGLVWAEAALSTGQRVGYRRFFEELAGAIDAAYYQLPLRTEREEILVADVVQARGVPLRAVAVLGLAEGEFPATLGEDAFLRDADRHRLREGFDLKLEPSTESAEVEFFYETVTRPWERLLLTRPRLAENGAQWEASPYWEEVVRLVQTELKTLTSESVPPPSRAASWPELMESLASHPGDHGAEQWVAQAGPERQGTVGLAARLFDLRRRRAASAHDGDLGAWESEFAQRYGPGHIWSASRLEAYRTCPYLCFVQKVLALEPRLEPAEGLDARQLGNVYHRILEWVYGDPQVHDAADLNQLLAVLPEVAGRVLDAAPQVEGFRENAWWTQTRDEILGNVRRSLEALAGLPGDYVPLQHEAAFGLAGRPPLVVGDGEDCFLLCGYIDRVDQSLGGEVRVIDYKTAGPSSYGKADVRKGKKLQLPLYALAAREALGLGEPVEGFYWHVQHAKPSGFTLGDFEDGPQAAMEVAVAYAWEAVRGVRDGHFAPEPADGNCPHYCPAAGFCWQYEPGRRG
jgi:RecB family exonuclease